MLILVVLAACTAQEPQPVPPPSQDPPTATIADADRRTRHLAVDGDDAGDGSSATPWRTWTHALEALEAGDILLVHGGEYRERVLNPAIRSGDRDAPIDVRAAPAERPVLRGLLWLEDADHWRIEGIAVVWDEATGASDEHMVKMTGGTAWVVRGNEFSGARSFAGLLVAGDDAGEPLDWRVLDNCIHGTVPSNDVNQDHLVYVNSGTHDSRGRVSGNLLFDAPNGNGIKLGGPRRDRGGAADVSVTFNTIVDTAQNVLLAWGTRDVAIEYNLMGRVGDGYGNVRGFELSGEGNRVSRNVGFGSARLILNDTGYRGLEDAGDNQHSADVELGGGGCDGFRPMTDLGVGHTAWPAREAAAP